MDQQIDGPLGLVVLYESASPKIDVVAVHGLGANPAWAWVSKSVDKNINWLADRNLLPSALPESRIMNFNYESRWHSDAPWQRRHLCADQLLTALDIERKKDATHRPLLFIGHSFGGIVIEQALLNATTHGGSFQSLATSTIGIVFLGTPHRGTRASKWGEIIAKTGAAFGFSTEARILQDLRQDSEALTDLLYNFTLWLFRSSVPTVCFFEQHETDYGKKLGGLFTWKELVVDERSACIDGHRKVALPTDHLKINKFSGPQDPAYKVVAPIISEMAHAAVQRVYARLHPREIIQDNSIVPREHMACLRSLLLTNPEDDLASVRRMKGDRINGTCEWLLATEEYNSWYTGASPGLLQITGDAGIGKTMISSFVVDEFQRKARQNLSITFAYYFCDNKVDKRKTSTAVLRGLLLQLLRQRPVLFKKMQEDYDVMQHDLRDNFDALTRNFRAILGDPGAGEVYLLIDAVDECEERSIHELLHTIGDLFLNQRTTKNLRPKLIITHRPHTGIEFSLMGSDRTLRIDSVAINKDLGKFIDERVELLSRSRKYSPKLEDFVKSILKVKAEGTFLWASLVLDDLGNTVSNGDVRAKLNRLPLTLYEVYDRILRSIKGESVTNAILLLRLMVVARRPLTVDEVAMACSVSLEQASDSDIPLEDVWQDRKDIFKCCDALLYRDPKNETINFVHQSIKDYLTDDDYLLSKEDLNKYYVNAEKANHHFLRICWTYLSGKKSDTIRELKIGSTVITADNRNCLVPTTRQSKGSPGHVLLHYAADHYCEHALAAGDSFDAQEWSPDRLGELPSLRDWLMLKAAQNGKVSIVRTLLQNGAQIKAKTSGGVTAIHWAAERGYMSLVDLLLEKTKTLIAQDDDGRTALHWAVFNGKMDVIRRIATHRKVVFVPIQDKYGWTALHLAVRMAEWDVNATDMIRILLENDADPNIRSRSSKTALQEVASFGRADLARLLLSHGAAVDIEDEAWKKVVVKMTESGFQSMTKLLNLKTGSGQPFKNWLPDSWKEVRSGLSRIFMNAKANIDAKFYIQMYTTIFKYCTDSQRSGRGADPRGKDFYNCLRDYLSQYLEELKNALEPQSDEELMLSYAREWTRYVTAAKKIARIFSYLQPNWIQNQLDEGRKNIFPVYDLHLVQWKLAFFRYINEKTMSCVLKNIDRQRNNDAVSVSAINTVLESFVLVSFSDHLIRGSKDLKAAGDEIKQVLSAPQADFQIKAKAVETIARESNSGLLSLVLALGRQTVPQITLKAILRAVENIEMDAGAINMLLDRLPQNMQITPEVVTTAAGNNGNGWEIMRLLLDRCGKDIQITPEVVAAAAANNGDSGKIMRLLLDRCGKNIQITPKVVAMAAANNENGGKIMRLLLDRCSKDIQITPEVVAAVVANNGNGGEIMTLLLDRRGTDIYITPEVVTAAAKNERNGEGIMTLLLDRRGKDIRITPEVVMAAAQSGGNAKDIIGLLLDRHSKDIQITPEVVIAAAGNNKNGGEIMRLLLDRRGKDIQITSKVVVAVAGNNGNGWKIMRLFLDRLDKDIQITPEVVTVAAKNDGNGVEIMRLLLDRRGKDIQITPEVVVAAAKNNGDGEQIIRLLLDRCGEDIQITPEVVVAAAGNYGNGRHIIRLLLDRRGKDIQITPEVVIAAAKNERNGEGIMTLLLDRRGKDIQIIPK